MAVSQFQSLCTMRVGEPGEVGGHVREGQSPGPGATTTSTHARAVKILHCAETVQGGIASYLKPLLPMQVQRYGKGQITLIGPQWQQQFLPTCDGARTLAFDSRGSRVARAWRLARQVVRMVREERFDIVHIHSTYAGALTRPLLWLSGVKCKVVYCPHGWAFFRQMPSWARRLTQWVERGLSYLTDEIVCVSDYERRCALQIGIPANRLKVIINGIPSRAPEPADFSPRWMTGRKRLLFVGRFDQQKGIDTFLAMMRLLGDEAQAYAIGGAVLEDQQIQALPDNVTLIEWLDAASLEAYFQSADVLVMPSRWEGLPLVAAEAMRARLAVLGSDVGGIPEIVDDGVTGTIVPRCTPQSLAAAVRQTSRDQWKQMGTAGRARFEQHFTIERVHRELCAIYESLLDEEPVMASR